MDRIRGQRRRMQNYWRAIKIALQYRWIVAGAFTCSLMVAVLWGGSIGALYPVLQVAVNDQSLQDWSNEQIAESKSILESKQAELQREGLPEHELIDLQDDISTEQRTLAWRQRVSWFVRQPWVPRAPFRTVLAIVVILVAATAVKGLFIFGNLMFVAQLEQRVTYDLRRQFFHRALRLDLDAFVEERTSGLLSRFNADIRFVAEGIRTLFGNGIREPLKMLSCLVGASVISPRLLIFSLVLTPIVGLLIRKLAGSIKRANRRVLEEITQLYGVLTETFNGIQTVQAYTLEQSERAKFYKVAKECFRKAMRISFYNALTKPITETTGIAVISMALLSGAYLTLNRETHLFGIRLLSRPMDTASLLIFYGMLIGATEPARKLSEIFNAVQAGVAASERLFPLLDQQPKIENPVKPITLPAQHSEVQFEDVSFHYLEGTPVLTKINLKFHFGETIAIVGPNGCGKSTLLQMLPRFIDPSKGYVRIDGIDVRDVRLKNLRNKVGLVTQRAHLFDDTIYNNIRNGRLDASETAVIRAAQKARAHKFITETLADGYETVVGASGSRLSGGQRQRIALARAMIRNPEILILDEATSQIDIESEQLIHQALEEFSKGRTVFMITHRLATLSLADRILVMNNGQVEDCGTHDELITRCELYKRLYSIQFKQSA
ncbi:MAG: ABC transporter ATP-binding protein [Planctomycetales bacterium]|nr:ABC transporter ATP-binding protein [Planctomycetales bacterium]